MKIFDFQQIIHHLLSLQKKKKRSKKLIKLEYISYTMTLDLENKLKCNKMAEF